MQNLLYPFALLCFLFVASKGEELLLESKFTQEVMQSSISTLSNIRPPARGICSRFSFFEWNPPTYFIELIGSILLVITVMVACREKTAQKRSANLLTMGLYLLSLFINVNATSSSNTDEIYLCNALSPMYGCEPRFWQGGDRLKCMNKTQLMAWATKPSRSNFYRLSAGNEGSPASAYTPDEYININLDVTSFDKQYRGILLYAVNSQEQKVGDFAVPAQDPSYFKLPWTDPNEPCYRSLMHTSAERKPLSVTFNFKAPPAGTGRITFRCLIKFGGPNTGDFYWPNLEGDLSLNEQTVSSTPSSISWERSNVGESCTSRCSRNSEKPVCHGPAILSLTGDVIRDQIATKQLCELPYVSGCGKLGSAFNPLLGVCYYTESNCTGREPVSVTCDTTISDMARNCPCVAADFSGDYIETSGANKHISGILSVLFLIPLLFGISPRIYFLMLIILLAFTQGHNWVNSPARSAWSASTIRPCKPQSSIFPHAQIGPGQTFEIEWSNGHGDMLYFTTVHESNYDKLKLVNRKLLDDYIRLAPNGTLNRAHNPRFQRYSRRATPNMNFSTVNHFTGAVTIEPNFYAEIINESDSRFIPRNRFFGGMIEGADIRFPNRTLLMKYPDSFIANDVYISYNSSKYPWIESVRRYGLKFWSSQFFQPDVSRFEIQGNKYGRYIVQYWWAGYVDCVDVDYKPTQVASVYGVPTNGIFWKRIDHCMFRDPTNTFRHSEVVTDAQYCLDNCINSCDGVNVVPLKAPSTVIRGIQPGPNDTWVRPDIYGFDFYVPWRFPSLNASIDRYAQIASEDKFMCYGIRMREPTNSESEYEVTDDPKNPVYYSTCYFEHKFGYLFPEYIESYQNSFSSGPWRMGKHCVDCQSNERSQDVSLMPNWKIADKCVDCDQEPVETPSKKEIIQLENRTRCDGLDGTFAVSNHTTCQNRSQCVKQLVPIGSRSVLDTVSRDECSVLVQRDPECSNIWFHRLNRQIRPVCYCYTNYPCCKTCSRVNETNSITYEVNSVPDPTCRTGVLSANNSTCCSASCGAGNCLPNAANRVNDGFCCSTCITRPCSKYGPPCKLDV